jgi:hypothetical protein
MTVNTFAADEKTFGEMKGLSFTPNQGEGVVYIKVVGLKPDTIKTGDPGKVCNDAQGVILAGSLSDIKSQINSFLDAMVEEYQR